MAKNGNIMFLVFIQKLGKPPSIPKKSPINLLKEYTIMKDPIYPKETDEIMVQSWQKTIPIRLISTIRLYSQDVPKSESSLLKK